MLTRGLLEFFLGCFSPLEKKTTSNPFCVGLVFLGFEGNGFFPKSATSNVPSPSDHQRLKIREKCSLQKEILTLVLLHLRSAYI